MTSSAQPGAENAAVRCHALQDFEALQVLVLLAFELVFGMPTRASRQHGKCNGYRGQSSRCRATPAQPLPPMLMTEAVGSGDAMANVLEDHMDGEDVVVATYYSKDLGHVLLMNGILWQGPLSCPSLTVHSWCCS